MDYTPKRKRVIKPEVNALQEIYPHDLQLYTVSPKGQISLIEFQDLALERQKVLQLLEATNAQKHKSISDVKTAFINSLKKEGYYHYARLVNALGCATHSEQDLEARRRDHISHYILRLAYSSKDELQKYLLSQETELFKLRFSSLNKEGINQFLITSGIHYSPISQEFKEKYRENLYAATIKDEKFETTDFYELPFEKVGDLVSDRKVYVHRGIAYVSQSDLNTVFVSYFNTNLSIELNNAKKYVLRNLDDERLHNFFKTLPDSFAGMSKVVWSTENTPISKLNDLSKTSYPLCMKIMHEHLMSHHHLKNTGRLQYGLFIKGIGVTLDDSIQFWKNEMTKREGVNEDKFNKDYLYHIRFNYGKVGRRVNYRPLGCSKLITEPVGPGEVHGCPYKHMDTDELSKKLNECKISSADIAEITKLSREGHYNLACTKYFESTHKQLPAEMFLHPNQYFEQSRKILTKDNNKEEENTPMDLTPISPEKISQSIKVKVENNLNSSNSSTPSRAIEKKVKMMDKKAEKMDPLNIAALLNDSD